MFRKVIQMPRTRNVIYGFLAAAAMAWGQSTPAPAPKAAHKAPTPADWAALGKLPDFTGVWEVAMGGGGARGGGRGAPGAPGAPAAPAAAGRGRAMAAAPALTPEYAAKAKELASASTTRPEDNPSANCLPPGMPAIMSQPYPIEVLMTPGLATIVTEAYTQVRHIYTDGRPMPEDPDPSFDGTSIGRWEGDTLVVESMGFEPVPRGINFPYSEKMKIVERFKLSDPDTLSVDTTIVDPLALTQPFSMGNRVFKRHRGWTIAEYVCEENNRNFVDDSGKAGIRLANPTASPK
jgi:hypothetical protein